MYAYVLIYLCVYVYLLLYRRLRRCLHHQDISQLFYTAQDTLCTNVYNLVFFHYNSIILEDNPTNYLQLYMRKKDVTQNDSNCYDRLDE